MKAMILDDITSSTFQYFYSKMIANASAIVLGEDGGLIAMCNDRAVAQGIAESYDEGNI